MILHHVAERSCVVVIVPTMFDPHFFSDGDGHILHIAPVPERLEEWVGKSECQNVLDRLLAQIMVNSRSRANPALPRYIGMSPNWLGGVAM